MSKLTPRERVAALSAPPEHDWFRIRNAAGTKKAEVYVYGTIGGGWWGDGVTAGEFNREVDALDVDEITLYVNSGGGGVSEAIAMRNHLIRHRAKVTAYVDGLAASAASFLITGADEVVMGENAELMIHDALSIVMGNAGDLREAADELDSTSDNIASMYAKKAGGDVADWRALMIAETWYSAEEAVEAGLADRVGDDDESAPEETENTVPLSIFAHAGRGDAPRPVKIAAVAELRSTYPSAADFHARLAAVVNQRRTPEPPAEPGSTNTTNPTEGVDPMADLKKELANRLGLQNADSLTDEQILAATDEALAERAEPKAAFEAPEGTVVVEKGVFDSLTANAARGAEAADAIDKSRREGIVDQALTEGRIAAASRETWLENLVKNEAGTVAILNTLAAGTVVNTIERGHAGDAAATSDEDRLYSTFVGNDDEKGE